jgi:aminoglycoside 6'-N-acetyltransferase I
MAVRPATSGDLPALARLRHSLWPQLGESEHRTELETSLAAPSGDGAVFVAHDASGRLLGFAEAALRHDYVNGCDTSPVAYLEGIYVDPSSRRTGVARALVASVSAWGAALGSLELASDSPLDNETSQRMHEALGFEETERVVFFRKRLGG